MAGHPGERQMYGSMRMELYRPRMPNDIHATVIDFHFCARNLHTAKRQRKRKRRLFPSAEPLELVAINIFGPLPKTKTGTHFILVMTDLFSNITKATSSTNTTSTTVPTIFVNNWVANFVIPSKFLTAIGPQFTSKFF